MREIEEERTRCIVLEVGGPSLVKARRVDCASQVNWIFPTEIVPLVLPMRNVQIDPSATGNLSCPIDRKPSGSSAVEEQSVAVGGKVGSEILGRTVDDRPKVTRLQPAILEAIALRDPKVVVARAARASRREVQAQSVFGQSGVSVVEGRVDEGRTGFAVAVREVVERITIRPSGFLKNQWKLIRSLQQP